MLLGEYVRGGDQRDRRAQFVVPPGEHVGALGAPRLAAFANLKNSKVQALLAIAGGLTFSVSSEIADLALAARLPLCSPFKETVFAGGLVSLGPDIMAMARQAAAQIDKCTEQWTQRGNGRRNE
jgi:hypothetical protein